MEMEFNGGLAKVGEIRQISLEKKFLFYVW